MKVMYFSAEWCGQCKVMMPKIMAACKKVKAKFEFVNCDSNEELVEKYNVKNIPYVVVEYDDGSITSGLASSMLGHLDSMA